MARLTKSDIEQRLLSGASVKWCDANNKDFELVLSDPKERRLFAFLLSSTVRKPTGLSDDFIRGLFSAFNRTDDPAIGIAAAPVATIKGPWRLQSIETEGFGGLNTWDGPIFRFSLDGESLLVEGPNGSGKSSLIGAAIWALSGERPRDQTDSHAHAPKPVFGSNEKLAGDWPPIACYPPTKADLKSPLRVRSLLTFCNAQGDIAEVERMLDGGTITTRIDPDFDIPSILLETGVLMPARLAALRLDEGRGRLTDAVQKLTGLDDLIAIGALADGLCHKAREYLAYKRKELSTAKASFDQAIGEARGILAAVDMTVADFAPLDTNDKQGDMAKLGKTLNGRAAELTKVISDDLADDLDLASAAVQHDVISAIGAAKAELEIGLSGISTWNTLESIAQALDHEATQRVSTAVASARIKGEEAVRLLEKSNKDTRFQLKAVASRWHHLHRTGSIENCPLCEHDLKSDLSLSQELEALRSAGDAAARTFDDNLNGILTELHASLPTSTKRYGSEALTLEPRAKLAEELRATFVTKDRYAKILTKFGALFEIALPDAPNAELDAVNATADATTLKKLNEKIVVIERLVGLAEWFDVNGSQWSGWWRNLTAADALSEGSDQAQSESEISEERPSERLTAHLDRLSDALAKAEPYRKSAVAMRNAWKAGLTAAEIQKELKRREVVAQSLIPLKKLGSFAEAIARETIEGLSGRIANLLKSTLLTEQLQFRSTRLSRKEGLVVRGGFVDGLHIDATLVANTSWLRAVLWAFLFSLREEAIEQMGSDQFPLFAFDDPQSTFDGAHRHRWAQYVASLQNSPSKAQIILTTYDEIFLDLIKVSGVTGRQAMIAAASHELKYVGIFEGESLDRKWVETKAANTNAAGRDYIAKVREYVEGLLRLMLRGEDAAVLSVVGGFVVGASREKLRQLNAQSFAPWDRSEFKKLVSALDKNAAPIKHMEIAHHSGGSHLGMA